MSVAGAKEIVANIGGSAGDYLQKAMAAVTQGGKIDILKEFRESELGKKVGSRLESQR